MLRTNTELDAAEVALQYKRLWMVEAWFRSYKSLLGTRPIYHRCDATIRGHVFCSFLALVLRQELQSRLEGRGQDLEWADVIDDLERLQITEVEQDGKRFLLRSEVEGTCGAAFQAAGVALPRRYNKSNPTPLLRKLPWCHAACVMPQLDAALKDAAVYCLRPVQHAAHSGLSCKGPERIFNGAAAMKRWKTSSAMYEPRNARFSFRLDPQWSGYGPILPQGTSRKPEPSREVAPGGLDRASGFPFPL